jgi:hypothetical protein
MFENAKITGTPVLWIAVPQDYAPGMGSYECVATGASEAIKMIRDAGKLLGKMPKYDGGSAHLIVEYSPVLLDDKRDGKNLKREIKDLQKRGEKVGVFCEETHNVSPRR